MLVFYLILVIILYIISNSCALLWILDACIVCLKSCTNAEGILIGQEFGHDG